jgi:hypothetical protein
MRCAALTSGEPLSAGSTRIKAGLLAWKALPAVNRESAAKACFSAFLIQNVKERSSAPGR